MPILPVQLFDTRPGSVFDLSQFGALDIFNRTAASRAASMQSLVSREDGTVELESPASLFRQPQTDPFDTMLKRTPQDDAPVEDYALPVKKEVPVVTKEPGRIKLSNYGYESDSSPDYNSNVLRIGHSNNRLEDGLSAALTPSLAKRFGIQRGGMFEAITDTGEVLKRRYDDTVPSTYKGKVLPETVDLFNTRGSNSFGGSVVKLRPLGS